MTEYVYKLTTNTPVGAWTGMGNAPVVQAGAAWTGALTERGQKMHAESNGAAQSDGHTFDLELVEIRSDVAHDVDAFLERAAIKVDAWQRGYLIDAFEQMRRRSS